MCRFWEGTQCVVTACVLRRQEGAAWHGVRWHAPCGGPSGLAPPSPLQPKPHWSLWERPQDEKHHVPEQLLQRDRGRDTWPFPAVRQRGSGLADRDPASLGIQGSTIGRRLAYQRRLAGDVMGFWWKAISGWDETAKGFWGTIKCQSGILLMCFSVKCLRIVSKWPTYNWWWEWLQNVSRVIIVELLFQSSHRAQWCMRHFTVSWQSL